MLPTVAVIVAAMVGAVVWGLVIFFAIPYRRPLKSESDYSHHLPVFWELNYAHKYLWPRTKAEPRSGLEQTFASMDLTPRATEQEGATTLSLRAVGDLMVRPALQGEGGLQLWDEVSESVFGGDLSMGNLEFSINSDRFIFKTIRYAVPPEWVGPLLGTDSSGYFDYVALGNNHVNDSLADGIRQTCEYLDEAGIEHSGAGRTPEEPENFPVIDVKGVKIALLSYSFSTNNVPLDEGKEYGINVVRFNAFEENDFKDEIIGRHVRRARERGADYILSNHHWCCDHEVYPPARVVERTHRIFDAGVDLILGHHPHIVGPIERYEASDGRECYAFYSLGSITTYALIFPWQKLSLIADITLQIREQGGRKKVEPIAIGVTPAYYSIREDRGIQHCRLLPVNDGARRIAAGEQPSGWTGNETKKVVRLAKFYRDLLTQKGVEYR